MKQQTHLHMHPRPRPSKGHPCLISSTWVGSMLKAGDVDGGESNPGCLGRPCEGGESTLGTRKYRGWTHPHVQVRVGGL